MKRAVALVSLLCLAAAAPAYAETFRTGSRPLGSDHLAAADAGEVIFAGGGTPLTNGIFFPGTATCDSKGCTPIGPPLQVKQGSDITFVNIDPAAVANTHRVVSIRKRKGRPMFASEDVSGPGQSVVPASHLKPGVYPYFCNVHFGMYGVFEVVK